MTVQPATAAAVTPARPQSIDIRVRDGLRLRVGFYPAPGSRLQPVVCLPGLTRNGRDFTDLARALSAPGPLARPVYTIDMRGRGLSEWDPNWKNYTVPHEALDVIDVLNALGLSHVALVGTSRGGLISMVLSAIQPSAIGLVVLNDIGPVIEQDGLIRIAGYVGRTPLPRSWTEATSVLRDICKRDFPGIGMDVWGEVARQWWNDKNGAPALGYDPELKNAVSILDGPMPALWAQFDALGRLPVLVIRGERSDLLSEATVAEMVRRHPHCSAFVVPDQGHAPLLKDTPSIERIAAFIAARDDGQHGSKIAHTSQAAATASGAAAAGGIKKVSGGLAARLS
ncbi:MAG: alpha/beta hydrolase [Hyphomicrobiaceae bacterium]|nr:alpha/beta hydrolase [Hyphomicrobiaceae bacterium]